jgi:hypothetical protein
MLEHQWLLKQIIGTCWSDIALPFSFWFYGPFRSQIFMRYISLDLIDHVVLKEMIVAYSSFVLLDEFPKANPVQRL